MIRTIVMRIYNLRNLHASKTRIASEPSCYKENIENKNGIIDLEAGSAYLHRLDYGSPSEPLSSTKGGCGGNNSRGSYLLMCNIIFF